MSADPLFLFLILLVSFLYASVGHGGASGYLALMVLFGMAPSLMKPSALMLNLFVSGIAFIQYYRQGFFQWKKLWPFIITSIPLSFIGARIAVDPGAYKMLLGLFLLLAVVRILGLIKVPVATVRPVRLFPALLIGGGIGLVSGMIGIGGGIILSPILILLHWADIKQTAAVSAAFIFLNSISGLLGAAFTSEYFQPAIYIWASVAIIGGTAGAYFGSSRFEPRILKYVLSVGLLFASYKLMIP